MSSELLLGLNVLSLSIRGNLLTFLSFDLCLLKFLWYYIVNDNSGHVYFCFEIGLWFGERKLTFTVVMQGFLWRAKRFGQLTFKACIWHTFLKL